MYGNGASNYGNFPADGVTTIWTSQLTGYPLSISQSYDVQLSGQNYYAAPNDLEAAIDAFTRDAAYWKIWARLAWCALRRVDVRDAPLSAAPIEHPRMRSARYSARDRRPLRGRSGRPRRRTKAR